MDTEKVKNYKDLIVWQKAKLLVIAVYKLTEKFPPTEIYGLSNQMRRAAVSITSNIAESFNRFHKKEKKQLLVVAFGSSSELESQIDVAKSIFGQCDYKIVDDLIEEVMKMLNRIILLMK